MVVPTAGRIRRGGLLAAVAGVVLVLYALTKGYLTSRIVAEGWGSGGLTPDGVAVLIHLAEEPLLLLIAGGFLSLVWYVGVREPLASAGVTTVFVSFGLVILTHLGEHLLAPLTVPVLTGALDLWIWSYYFSWLALLAGFGAYGLAIAGDRAVPAWLPVVLVTLGPATVVAGVAVAVTDLFTLAGTLRLAVGATWVILGSWLWTLRADTPTPFDGESRSSLN